MKTEVLIMKNRNFTCINNDVPKLNEQESKMFLLNVEYAILTSLVKRQLLTNSQAEQCKKIIEKQCSRA